MDEVSSTKVLLLMVRFTRAEARNRGYYQRQRSLKKELKPACRLEEQADRAEAIGISLTHLIRARQGFDGVVKTLSTRVLITASRCHLKLK